MVKLDVGVQLHEVAQVGLDPPQEKSEPIARVNEHNSEDGADGIDELQQINNNMLWVHRTEEEFQRDDRGYRAHDGPHRRKVSHESHVAIHLCSVSLP